MARRAARHPVRNGGFVETLSRTRDHESHDLKRPPDISRHHSCRASRFRPAVVGKIHEAGQFRIGYQKAASTLVLLKAKGTLDQNGSRRWA